MRKALALILLSLRLVCALLALWFFVALLRPGQPYGRLCRLYFFLNLAGVVSCQLLYRLHAKGNSS